MLRVWRLFVLAAAAWLLHVAAQRNEVQSRQPAITLAQALRFFPDAHRVSPAPHPNGADEVYNENDRLIGFVTTTSPQADSVLGYAGPNNVLVGLDSRGKVVGLELLSSADTQAHVADVTKATSFWKQFVGWTPSREALPKVDGVAGSTLTSLGIAEALQKRIAGRTESLRFPDPVTLDEVRGLYPAAHAMSDSKEHSGWLEVKDGSAELLGFAVRTSPFSDYTHGHSGPTESLLAITPDGKNLTGIRIRRSYDTDDYVDSVREDAGYLKQLTGISVKQWAKLELKNSGLEGVSGATETSFAVAEGIKRRLAADLAPKAAVERIFKPRDWALCAILAGSVVMTFTGLRGKRFVRVLWQTVLIGVFGLWFGNLLSLALLAGWARNGVAWQIAPSLVLMGAVALIVPWATRQQVYCYQLCPHGAAQEWLGNFKRLHVRVPDAVSKYLRYAPALLLAAAFLIGITFIRFDLARLEAFDAWALRGTAIAATVIAIVGLLASLFVPMAYCRYGCATGALLKFVRTTGSNDRFGVRDGAALLLLALATTFIFVRPSHGSSPRDEHATELSGHAFGTTWSVKLRGRPKDTDALQQKLAAELGRIESTLSHWRSNSATAQFNNAQTTQPIDAPEELVKLVARTLEISRVSNGAFDITVAPLVSVWGFGPEGKPEHAPTLEQIANIRTFTGWEKLTADTIDQTLRKSDPRLRIDLGAILQGYAADRLASLLNTNTEYLIDVGGELLARGQWRVAIEDPAEPGKPLKVINLENQALATSGTYKAKRTDGKKRWSHLINPTTGTPVEHNTTLVTVLHPSCAEADAWATTLLVSGADRIQSLAETNNLAVLCVSGGKILQFRFPQ